MRIRAQLEKRQAMLAERLCLEDGFTRLQTVAGCAQTCGAGKVISAIVVCNYPGLQPIAYEHLFTNTTLAYIPGLLCFREDPAICAATARLEEKPDVLLVPGHGIAHPRKLGLATYVGILLRQPTVGVAKRLLYGRIEKDAIYIGTEVRASCLRTRPECKPVYVSPGQGVSLATSLQIVRRCLRGHRLPGPLRFARLYARSIRRGLLGSD